MTATDLPLVIARAAPLIMRVAGTTEPLAYTPPRDETDSQVRACLKTLQTAIGGYVEAVPVPADASLILLVNEHGLLLKLPPNPQASAVALCSIVGDAVLMARTLLC